MNKVKNVHSPVGMGYDLTGTRLVNLKDCPKCKYGTLDPIDGDGCIVKLGADEKSKKWKRFKCADCGALINL